jgi:hypothetical protein
MPEAAVMEPLGEWISRLFARENRDRTVAALVASQHRAGGTSSARKAIEKRLEAAESRLRRLQSAIEAGVEPAALVEGINEAQAQREAARAELGNSPRSSGRTEAEVYAMVDSLGDVGRVVKDADPAKLEELFVLLRLEMTYNAEGRMVDVTIRPAGRVNAYDRGPSCSLNTRLALPGPT